MQKLTERHINEQKLENGKENTKKNLHEIEFSNDFLNVTPKELAPKEKLAELEMKILYTKSTSNGEEAIHRAWRNYK